jgi:hypothetical protein
VRPAAASADGAALPATVRPGQPHANRGGAARQ